MNSQTSPVLSRCAPIHRGIDSPTGRTSSSYTAARWPEGPPADLARRFDLARVYWDFRWLGDRPEWTGSEKVGPRFEHLRAAVARLSDAPPS